MSSGEEEQTSRRKKAHRPCDMCRKKKRRCDGEEPCSRCIKYGFTCTYEQKAVKRASTSYVQSLESRLKTVESLLRQQQQAPSILPLPTAPRPSDFQKAGPGVQIVIASIRAINSPFPAPHPDDASWNRVSDKLKHLKISGGFHGKSSPTNLVDKVIGAKDCGQTGEAQGVPKHAVSERPWTIRPWTTLPPKKYIFPEDNLLVSLATLYFTHFNFYYPLLHRDTFERDLANGLHLKSETEFGATVLLVCALGAQYSTDPRVRSGIREAPPGNVWFDQVDLAGSAQPSLYTLQSYCLATLYLERTSGARACWTLVGTGIRFAQDIGAHRERIRKGPVLPEAELEKRAYWVLTQLDTQFSAALGRSIAIPTHDVDLAFPIRCDDQFWLDGTFTQPPDLPSVIDFFVLQLKLHKILSYTLKIFYATSRNQRLIGLNDDHWIEPLVVEFDSALNGWFESIPSHLQWNPNKSAPGSDEDPTFFDQAAVLHCMYHFAQIMLHRPFIPAAHQTRGPNAKPRTFPSLAICTNAARAVAGLVDEYNQHRPNRPLVCGPTPAFTAGVVLLLNVWGIARSNKQATGSVVGNKERATEQDVLDLKDVRRCLDALRMYKDQWPGTAQLSDTLEQLLNIDIEQAVHVQFPYPPPQGPPKSSRGYSPSPFSGPELDADMLNDAVVAGGWSDPVSFGASANAVPSLAYFERMGSPPVDPEFAAMLRHTPGPDEEEPAQLPIFDLGLNGPVTANGGGDPFAMDVDVDTVAFWSHAPSAFEVSDWDLYLGFLGHLSSTPSSSGPSTVDNASNV